ncbi:hypothetical protein Y1Q_0004650 [Alligator mississippiensis]|uniref:Uncharacterized protein n=1 Tax=Alligator mississippiensis TaxID=8496 RepID=A0A151MHT3_ALLMI|nr:hypothetical protein Y1Q_0004650 [Alligator mississippiensis]
MEGAAVFFNTRSWTNTIFEKPKGGWHGRKAQGSRQQLSGRATGDIRPADTSITQETRTCTTCDSAQFFVICLDLNFSKMGKFWIQSSCFPVCKQMIISPGARFI